MKVDLLSCCMSLLGGARDKMNPRCMIRIGGSSSGVGVCDAMHAKSRTRLRCSDTGLAAYR
jgi:hypothetical protein